MRKLYYLSLAGLLWILSFHCQPVRTEAAPDEAANLLSDSTTPTEPHLINILNPHPDSLRSLWVAGHWVDIRYPPDTIRANILVLPGWDFPRQDWCEKSSLCEEGRKRGYRLILPEMGRSVYSSRFYPETRSDWRQYPNKAWIVQEMIPTLQKEYGILLPKQPNYILGLSTGGRGVALVALALPELFRAAAALSGDFDQTQIPADRLMIGYYGSLTQFPDRWIGEDNPLQQAASWKLPLYLGHGKLDQIVPYQQSLLFYQVLHQAHPELKILLNLPEAGHDYRYWDSEVKNIYNFFEQVNDK
ncbi:MAG: prolyl oligopeptidase family serine peptidase [Bacteroidia bacterium]|nr:prolyl oligopeptidase family serine peptidase [Bacteroidia bacterium]